MTLKARNRSLLIFNFLSILCLVGSSILLIYTIVNGNFEKFFSESFFSFKNFSLFKKNEKSVVLSLMAIQIYIPVTTFLLFYNFEKTQSPIIILFGLFLFGMQLEISKLLIGLLGLKNSYSDFHLFLANLAFLGKLISIMSLFLISAYSKETQKLNIEIDIIVLLAICIFATFYIPFNTFAATNTFGLRPGYLRLVLILFSIITILTIITFIFTYKETENILFIKLLFSYLPILAGNVLTTETNIFILIILGIIFLYGGTYYLFKFTHKLYSWD